jgi:hypothetical protein
MWAIGLANEAVGQSFCHSNIAADTYRLPIAAGKNGRLLQIRSRNSDLHMHSDRLSGFAAPSP